MRRRATLVIDRKFTLEDGSIVEAVVWELPIPLKGSPHRYKYRDIPTLLKDFRNEIEMAGGGT